MAIALFLAGLILLIKGGDWFVEAAAGIARRFHVPEFIIGATVVSIGTTLPEVMVSVSSALGGHGEMSYGNAIGSVICNTALIAALSITVKPGKTDAKALKIPVAFFFFAAAVYGLTAYASGYFSRATGLALLSIFFVYMVFTLKQAKKEPNPTDYKTDNQRSTAVKDSLLLLLGAVMIAFGANLLIHNGILIAQFLGVPEAVIALTFVAVGTSLPELVTAITALVKGHGALSLGNIIGAYLFNLVLVSGLAAALAPFTIPQGTMIAGGHASLLVDLPVMLLSMAVLTFPLLKRGRLFRWQGILLLLIYTVFCVIQFSVV